MKLSVRVRRVLRVCTALTGLISLLFVGWLIHLNQKINASIETPWFVPPLEIYTAPTRLKLGKNLTHDSLFDELRRSGFRERSTSEALFPKDFTYATGTECRELINQVPDDLIIEEESRCFLVMEQESYFKFVILLYDTVTGLYEGAILKSVSELTLPAKLFAQFYGEDPIIRKITTLEEFPVACLNSVLAIEDHRFLEHSGISIIGIARAVFDLVRTGGQYKSGGSTITQQMVRNYFLTLEKTLTRKFTEIFMSLLIETKIPKEKILESYLNIIYMGQNGPFQIRGFTAASEYYFNKPVFELNTSECALLAGVLNSPGRFNPHRHPERAKKRRNKVLSDMKKYNFIDEEEFNKADRYPLPRKNKKASLNPAPYFVDAVRKSLVKMGLDPEDGFKVYTTLNPKTQKLADRVLKSTIKDLETRKETIKKHKEEGKLLQGMMLVIDVNTGEINALMGGRDFKQTQYNRAVEAHRQVGSVMKPLVYLTALETTDEEGNPYTPLSIIPDKRLKYKYDGQVWSPNNYSRVFHGDIPMYYSLKNSINASTAQLGLNVGLDSIIDVAKRLGIESELDPVPALTLGAFELYPFEVAQAFLTIARMGNKTPVHTILKVTELNDKVVYEFEEEEEQIIAPDTAAQLVGMMKQTIESGTAKWMRRIGFNKIAAGKTGTTSDSKDAWFVGFTPNTLVLVWVGYDDNTPHELTGASGAVPVWYHFMRQFEDDAGLLDFQWPEGMEVFKFDPSFRFSQLDSAKHLQEEPTAEVLLRTSDVPNN